MVIALGAAATAWAQDASPVAEAGSASAPAAEAAKPATRRKRSRQVDRETEGTEALGRFEADTVIKSSYQLNGEPLEVDPD